jgi:hypothetical protein
MLAIITYKFTASLEKTNIKTVYISIQSGKILFICRILVFA